MPHCISAIPFLSSLIVVARSTCAGELSTSLNRLARAILFCLCAATASASNDRIVTAVFSHTYNGYQRPRAADGTFQREYYALANGSYMPGVAADASIDKVKFPQIAGLTAQFLALHNYLLAPDAKQARILLLITWGKTIPLNDAVYTNGAESFGAALNYLRRMQAEGGGPRGPDGAASAGAMVVQDAKDQFEQQLLQLNALNDMRRKADEYNAKVLGYVDEINDRDSPARFAGAGSSFDDLIDDIENERYFFVISAYDFPTAVKTGQRKLLWVTRVSVQAQGNKFNETAAYMLAKASKYFGQDSGRLVRQFDREGKVTLGELQVVGVVPESKVHDLPPEEKK
jgi:hypothetical protein